MKLSKVTIEILKNMATINQGIIINPGSELKTMNVVKSTLVQANIPDVFPCQFAIYDLNEFLSTISLFENCDIQFMDTHLEMTEGNQKIKYYYSVPSTIISPGEKTIKMTKVNKSFVMNKEVFERILKTSSVMKLKDFTIDCDGLTVCNRNNLGNIHTIEIPIECDSNSKSRALFKVEALKLIPLDYNVTVNDDGIARFESKSPSYNIEYFIAFEYTQN